MANKLGSVVLELRADTASIQESLNRVEFLGDTRQNAQISHSEDLHHFHVPTHLLLRNRCTKVGQNKIEGT